MFVSGGGDQLPCLTYKTGVAPEVNPAADQGGGGAKGPWPPLSLLKLVIKKMAATGGP